MRARRVFAHALAAATLLAGCQSGTQGTLVTSPQAPTEPSFPTARPSTSRPVPSPTTQPSTGKPTPPPTSVSPPAAQVLPPDDTGYVFIQTKSGQTRCQLDAQSVGCEAP